MQLTEGKIIAEHYKLLRQLGHGSFGDVWLAHNMLADIDVAIKFYGTLDAKGLEEFRNEFKIAYKLRHPNLLNINHFDVFENCPYLVMPYCENGSASLRSGQMPESEIWKFVLDVSGGLAFLHSQNPPIVHQDIKPDNILLTSDGRYVISDFGISRKFRTKLSRTNNNTSSSGTIAYMGPERFSEKPMIVLASDIWALGMTIYELMTGDVLWEGMGGCVQLNGARIPTIEGNFSQALISLVNSCLAAETWNRPTAIQIQDYASAYMQHKPLPPLPVQEVPVQETKPQAAYETLAYQTEPPAPLSPAYTPNYYPSASHESSSGSSHSSSTHTPAKTTGTPLDNKTLKRGILIAAIVFCCIVLTAGFILFFNSISEEQDFLSCKTKQDYEQFIKDYPESSYVEKAKKRIQELTPTDSTAVKAPEPAPSAPTAVAKETPQKQTSIVEKVVVPEEPEPAPAPPVPPVAAKPKKSNAKSNAAAADDQAFYRCATALDYHNYLTRFPNGKHRAEAANALSSLVNQQQASGSSSSGTSSENMVGLQMKGAQSPPSTIHINTDGPSTPRRRQPQMGPRPPRRGPGPGGPRGPIHRNSR